MLVNVACFKPDPATRLSLERAREYDRVSELYAARGAANRPSIGDESRKMDSRHGLQARRSQFDKTAFRQPVLTQAPMLPRKYRRGQADPLTEECRQQLREMSDYALMSDSEIRSGTTQDLLSEVNGSVSTA